MDGLEERPLLTAQVDSNGFSWRSGAKVEKQYRRQWFLRITNYKEALLNDLASLSHENRWPARVISMQQHWLGKSEGARVKFQVSHNVQDLPFDAVRIFTTRPDTLHGVQYLALSISHPLVAILAPQLPHLQAFIDSVPSLPMDSKAGFLLPGITATNPLSKLSAPGIYASVIPIYVAPYVLDYGEKAVMGVPGHDSRDLAFWKTQCGDANIRRVVEPIGTTPTGNAEDASSAGAYEQPGVLASACGDYRYLSSEEASARIIDDLGESAERHDTWRLRDWLISRQRYWGTPIPIVHCPKCGPQPVPTAQLPVSLPNLEQSGPVGVMADADEQWLHTICPSCGDEATRETDTMDTFMDSSWYFMRFADPKNTEELLSTAAAKAHLPVDIYIGGIEHAILHLLYARFISKFLVDHGVWPSGIDEGNNGEPFRRVISQGMVHGKTFTDPKTGRFLKLDQVDISNSNDPRIMSTGEVPNISWEKMSKSKHNGVDPNTCVSRYGADVTRAHMLFQAPVSQVLEWDEERIVGIERWFIRIWKYLDAPQEAAAFEISYLWKYRERLSRKYRIPTGPDDWAALDTYFNQRMKHEYKTFKEHELKAWLQVQKTIQSVTASLSQTFALNTVISDLMELSNILIAPKRYKLSWQMCYQAWSAFFRMLAPIAPAFAEECWERMHGMCRSTGTPKTSIFHERWPEEDGSIVELENRGQTCAVQENGKFRFAIEIERPPDGLNQSSNLAALKQWAVDQIEGTKQGKLFLENKTYDAMHVIRNGKTVNFVTQKSQPALDRREEDERW